MATFSQLPGTLNLNIVQGDSVSVDIDFDRALGGYEVSAAILSAVTGLPIAEPSVVIASSPNGIVTLSMTSEQTATIKAGTYAWEMSWSALSGESRKVLSGFVEVKTR